MRFLFGVGPNGELDTERRIVLAYEKARDLARYDGAARYARLLRMPLSAQAGGHVDSVAAGFRRRSKTRDGSEAMPASPWQP